MEGSTGMGLEEWVAGAKKGDREALIQLVMDKREDYYQLAWVYLKNREDSLDAMQDMIVILFENIRKLRDPQSFYSWSKTILVNCCRNSLRKKHKTVPMEIGEEAGNGEVYDHSDTKRDLMHCLGRLNESQQEAIRLKYFMDLDYESIARLVQAPVGTVKSRVFNGLARMKQLLGGEYR